MGELPEELEELDTKPPPLSVDAAGTSCDFCKDRRLEMNSEAL